jgi:glycosyltransferase involved in cell wall biosynthesis
MITYDQLEKRNPRADLIRFKSLGKTLAKRSIDVVYITSSEKRRYEEGAYEGSKVYKVPLFARSNIIQLFFFYIFLLPVLFRAKQGGGFDIIFVNSIFTVPVAWILKFLSRNARIQFDLMGILSEEKFIRRPKNFWYNTAKKALSSLEDFLWSHVDFVTTINDQHKNLLFQRIKKPIYVVRDGVFEAVWTNPPRVEKDPVQDSNIILIFTGQINYCRLDPLFKILPTLIAEVPRLQFQVLGEGPQLIRYKEMALNLGLEEHVAFLGHVPHEIIFDYIEKADIAYSDDWSINGFPMKLFDYMALGKAIVAEGTESVKELLTDQVNGLLYMNEAELKEKILKLAKDAALREKLGKAAKGMMDQHTWDKRVGELKLIYQQFISQMEMT